MMPEYGIALLMCLGMPGISIVWDQSMRHRHVNTACVTISSLLRGAKHAAATATATVKGVAVVITMMAMPTRRHLMAEHNSRGYTIKADRQAPVLA